MKKRLLAGLMALLIAVPLTSCRRAEAGNSLTLLGKQSDLERDYMTAVFDLYERSTGNKLKLIAIEDSGFESEAAKLFESGDAPDIFLHFNNSDLARFDVENNFYDLSGEVWVSDLTDGARSYCQDAEGRLLGLPFWESSVSGCYYNKTILDSLGLNPAATQADFDMLCAILYESGYTPICWPADGCSWMPQFGLDPVFADDPDLLKRINANEISYSDIPAVHSMMEWIAGAAEKGWFGDDYLKTGWDGISGSLSSGQAVMTFIWDTWFYTDFTPGKYTVDDFALMPVFLGTAKLGTYEGGNLNMMMVNKNSEKLEMALEFLEFCATPENYNAAFDGISTVSCFLGQTTNIQSRMITDAQDSVKLYERVSTASSRVVGYSGEDMLTVLRRLFTGEVDVDGCIELMDKLRIEEAREQGIAGYD